MEPDVVVREEGSLVSRLTEPADSVVSGTRGYGSGGSDSVSEGSKEHDRADTGHTCYSWSKSSLNYHTRAYTVSHNNFFQEIGHYIP